MLRGGVIILVAFMSVKILKRKLFRHHFFGLFLVVLGITIIGVSAITNAPVGDSNK
jgi:hypothetical protein